MPDRLFTKFVEPRWLEDTLKGRLKFGTLAEYREAETGVEHRLTDASEGSWMRSTFDSIGDTLTDADGNQYTNIQNLGSGRTIARRTSINVFVFCATLDSYDEDTHRQIHAKNGTLTHYVCFDGPAFERAAIELQRAVYSDAPLRVGHAPVRYRDARETVLTARQLIEGPDTVNFADMLLTKPKRFAHEREIRFVLGPVKGADKTALFTRDHSPDVVALFCDAVRCSGKLRSAV